MKNHFIFTLCFFLLTFSSLAQVGINADQSAPDPAAMLDVNSTNRGFLPPRLSYEQRNTIANPVEGLLVYCTNCNLDGSGVLSVFQNGKWCISSDTCYFPLTPASGIHEATANQITWHWNSVPIAQGYSWNTVPDLSTATNMGTALAKSESGLAMDSVYTRYVWAFNGCGFSAVLTMTSQTPASISVPINNSTGRVTVDK